MASAHNDYDSSDEDEDAVPSQNSSIPYLGFIDAPITEDDKPTIEDSFVGGSPVWFHKDSPPPSELLLCKVCNAPLALISQSFAPLEETLYDRILYVFACQNASCRRQKGSVRAIRAVQKDPVKMKQLATDRDDLIQKQFEQKLKLDEQRKIELEATKNLFTSGTDTSNPFGGSSTSNPFGSKDSNPFSMPVAKPAEQSKKLDSSKPTFASVAQKAVVKETPSKSKPETVKLKQFPGFYIYVQEEEIKKSSKKKDEMKMTTKIEDLDTSVLDTEFDDLESSSKSKASTENLESLRIASMLDDPIFGNFADTISYNSQQVLRYDLGGKPLLYSSKDSIYSLFVNEDDQLKVPNPGYNPSSARQFEFQLMPKLILDLEGDSTDILNGMEWGTIIVCTDVEDYVPKFDDNNVGYVEEWCGVQWEEEVKR